MQTQPPPRTCPSAEELACYIDGALSPEDRARVAEHLASCESCFELYSEVLQFKVESEPAEGAEPESGKVVPFPVQSRERERQWYRIAALLLVGIGSGTYLYLHLFAPPPELVTAQLAASLHDKNEAEVWRGTVNRGGSSGDDRGSDVPSLSLEVTAFRTGVQILNLQAKLQANDGKAVMDTVIPAALTALDGQLGVTELEDELKGITLALSKNKAPKDLLPQISTLSTEARDLDPISFDFGQWVEAGRFAAISHDPAFFRLSETQSFLRRVHWRDRLGFKDSKLVSNSRSELDAIAKVLDKDNLRPADYGSLKEHFKKILDANYPD